MQQPVAPADADRKEVPPPQGHGDAERAGQGRADSSAQALDAIIRIQGFGNVIVEAMACGLPVVSFDCLWGPRSIIKDGEDGILVESGNIVKLAETLISLFNNPDKIAEMGKNARNNVLRFNIDTIAEKWKRLFDSL